MFSVAGAGQQVTIEYMCHGSNKDLRGNNGLFTFVQLLEITTCGDCMSGAGTHVIGVETSKWNSEPVTNLPRRLHFDSLFDLHNIKYILFYFRPLLSFLGS